VAADRPNGPTLARYHLGEALGGGPTGEVFRGKVFGVAGFERQFAVKRFHLSLTADPARLKALVEAARRYQTIEHPRIARLHELGHEGDQYFAAVELVPGMDLARLTAISHGQGQPLPPGAALSLLAQLLRAAAYAQGRGVFHLGISPSNVIASVDGDAKLTDFGFLATRLPPRPADEPGLLPRVVGIEQTIRRHLEPLRAEIDVIAEVRGRGAMMAVEFADPHTLAPRPDLAQRVAAACHAAGVLALTCGTYGNVIRLLPPLVIEEHVLKAGLEILTASIRSIAAEEAAA
jgi:serine/threonine protein kinase